MKTQKSPDHETYKFGNLTVKFLWSDWTWTVLKPNGFGLYSGTFEECEKVAKDLQKKYK